MNRNPPLRLAGESDEALAVRAGGGSVAAFELLVERFEGRIYSFLRRRCRNASDLEDLTQNTFLEAWRSIARYSPQWRFSTWIFTIATRQATAWLRRSGVHQRAVMALSEIGAQAPPDPLATAACTEERENLWSVAERVLDPLQQIALWLRYAEGLPAEEVARVIDRPAVTTRVILFRARQALKTALTAREEAESPGTTRQPRSTARNTQKCEVADVH